MDNNNPNPVPPVSTPATAIPPQPVQSAPVVPTTPVAPPKGGLGKIIIILVVVLLIILSGVAVYFFIIKQPAKTPQDTIPQAVIQTSPKPENTVDALEKDINTIQDESLESDFSSVDSDLQNL